MPQDLNTLVAYVLKVQDILEESYFVLPPKAHDIEGHAYCVNFIRVAYETGINPVDAAFVLCNKIQRKRWLETDDAG